MHGLCKEVTDTDYRGNTCVHFVIAGNICSVESGKLRSPPSACNEIRWNFKDVPCKPRPVGDSAVKCKRQTKACRSR
jgi:hypothetical protein